MLLLGAVKHGTYINDGLERLSETHIVREDAAQTVAGERHHPAEASDLVLAQLCIDALRDLVGFLMFAADILDEIYEIFALRN